MDFTCLCAADSDMPIKNMVDSFVLKQFIIYNMRNFFHFTEVVLDSGMGNIVCGTNMEAIQREITECLSEQGMTRHHPKERVKETEGIRQYWFECENVHIAVLSSQPRMKATTAAIGLSSWLSAVGASVCYVEENQRSCCNVCSEDVTPHLLDRYTS